MKLNLGILNPDTPIYRIVDFFDAIALLQTKLLRFSRISKFSDENEGIDLLLHALFLSHGPCKGAIGYSWKTTEDAILHHKLTQSRFYACCWTGDPDSIAMWTLYSSLKLGVRLQTTIGKLASALETHQIEEAKRLRNTPIGSIWTGFKHASVTSVRYVDLAQLHKRINRFGRAYSRFIERRLRHGEEAPNFAEGGRGPNERVADLLGNFSPFSVKSAAYQHEQEIRALFHAGSEVITQKLAELFDRNLRDDWLLECVEDATSTEEYTFIKVPDDFIVAVCVDPRAPAHWTAHMEETLVSHGCNLQNSQAFGYLPLTHTFEIGNVKN